MEMKVEWTLEAFEIDLSTSHFFFFYPHRTLGSHDLLSFLFWEYMSRRLTELIARTHVGLIDGKELKKI